MNSKDREALDKFIDEDVLPMEEQRLFAAMSNEERVNFIAERFFEAGAKHGRSQLNELRDHNMSELYEVIKKLQKEIDEFTSILDLKKETIVEMQNAYETLNAHDEMLITTVDKLKEENKKLVEALKFYENCSALMLKQRDLPIDPILGRSVLTERHVQDNGDVARQALKEIGEE